MQDDIYSCSVCLLPLSIEQLFDHNRKCRMREQTRRKVVLGWPMFHVLEPPADDLPVPRVSMILPGLWLGTAAAARDEAWLRQNRIRAIINAASDVDPSPFSQMFDRYLKLSLHDTNTQELEASLPAALALLKRAGSDYPILVHCAMGVSRSATIVAAHLMYHRHCLSLSQALVHLTQARPVVYPNRGFLGQLRELEEQLYSDALAEKPPLILQESPWNASVLALHGDLLGIDIARGRALDKGELEEMADKEAKKWRGIWKSLRTRVDAAAQQK